MSDQLKKDALQYHVQGRPGKIEVVPTKPYSTQKDLALAYSPGVAAPCLEIADKPEDAYNYTAKGNLVAVISNGTAVLGLGNIGALAGKPVMEGKGLLFKTFADIDVFDIEMDTEDVDKFIETVKIIAPTFGGINLEDIKAPQCFEIEERLKAALDIPVMHDDQHGTAIISSAAFLNALEIAGKKIEDVQVVVNGAGASAMACSRLYFSLGVKRENLVMCDSKGVIHESRTDLNKMKREFATTRNVHTLEGAMRGADMFLGLSVADILTAEMIQSMNETPIVFALANPDPEIAYEKAIASRPDIIFATGRSDYPNQVNNVLGFPYIFRGALDVRAKAINEEMKIAAVKALATLAKEPVPEIVSTAYNQNTISFGREYLIPKPLDPRLISTISTAVAKAAVESGVARKTLTNWEAYSDELDRRLGHDNSLIRTIRERIKNSGKRLVLPEGSRLNVLQAAQAMLQEGIATPILLGNRTRIQQLAKENKIDLEGAQILEFYSAEGAEQRERYAQALFEKRQRQGVTLQEANRMMYANEYFGIMMVEMGDADAFVSGYATKYSDTIRPIKQIIGTNNPGQQIAGMYMVMTKRGPIFLADTTIINPNPDAEALKEITLLVNRTVGRFNIEPAIALLSHSNFGSTEPGDPAVPRKAVELLHQQHPEVLVDGEIQANFALNKKLRMEKFPFAKWGDRNVNTLIFPSHGTANITHKLLHELSGSEIIGPILLGIEKPVHVLPMESTVREIVNMATIAVLDAIFIKESSGQA
ncbi:NADP-dependent malic enzyme [Mangrovibacterium marinum]|uniref:Allosteric NADP-dependent malic enzyme n=1 Tax=Mangrovibacterium marinum TaxID=1639118 RepID=A0A2T5C1L3_9BACT|nr:NADP-dependent malic enzyme [Mangrovibacterium marinum]PTN08468.1 allosteric NADP-dependent malic enzyme [Mangrovibacterium marinum]